MHIAFIGVGNMGRPMLANLLKKGFSAIAYDIVPAALDSAVALGAARAASPAEAAAAGDIVITILPSSGNVEAAYLGGGGILEGIARGKLCVDMSTIDPGAVAKLCKSLIAGAAVVAVSVAFRIAEGYGVDPKVLTRVIANSSGATWVMEKNHPVPGIDSNSAASRDYAPGFMTDLMAK